ncbi:MAG: DnaJ domain-containing protein, partial [Ilumatobacteraceae bacterium]
MAPQREWFEKDYYRVLGVAEGATQKEITKAYRKLARELHPDANPGNSTAEDRFKDVSAAYDVLGDEAKRAEYDEVRKLGPMGPMGPMGGGYGAQGAQGPGGFRFNVGDAGGLGDVLGQMFGGGRRRSGGSGAGPRRGADLE